MFKLSAEKFDSLRSQFVISKRGGIRYLPRAFPEQGVYMLSTVLKSKYARKMVVQIMRVFTKMRQMIQSKNKIAEIVKKLEEIENRQDVESKAIWNKLDFIMKEIGELKYNK